MDFFELEAVDISSLNDGDLRDLVARLCEAELIQQDIQSSAVTWGGAQEAADGGLDVSVKSAGRITNPNFVARENTGFQVKKNSMSKAACRKEMEEDGRPKAILLDLTALKGAYVIVSGKDDCSDRMLSERLSGMKEAVISLPNKDDLHLDFYGRDRILAWLRRHPSVALWVRSRLGKPLAGWKPYGRWAATPPKNDDEFLVDKHPCVIDANSTSKAPKPISEGIQLTRDRLRNFGSIVRITGLSGVGKTRFAQALFETKVGLDALPASDVIYADLGNHLSPTGSELVTYLIANNFSTFLVLDNCPPDVHRSLQKQVAGSSAKLRLLTIEYDISDDKPEETEVIHLEPSSEETVSKLVQTRFSDLDRVNADRIAEFAGGNARVAIALASRVNADESLSNFSDEDLFQRLFAQRKGKSPELLQAAESLSLVYSFNISSAQCGDELSVVARIAGLTRKELYRHQAELFQRQLAQQSGNWRAILPHALANRLAKRALENVSLEDINGELFKPENLRLFQSCAHRLGYLHDSVRARELAITWLRPYAPLGDIASCSDEYLVALHFVAPVFPEVVLHAIEQASAKPGFAARTNRNFTRFVELLCRIAYDDKTFDRAIDVLLIFAETEKCGEKNNSIVDQMKQFFSLYLSGTEATPQRRQAFVKKLLNSGNQRHQEIAAELLHCAFGTHQWVSFGTFHFGARKRGPGWHPTTANETIAWYIGYLLLVHPLLSSAELQYRDWAKSLLASHFRELWTFAKCFDVLETIIRQHGLEGNWLAMWISIKNTIALDSEKQTAELLARLESIERLTAPVDPYNEIEAYVLVDVSEHINYYGEDYDNQTKEVYEKVIALGRLAVTKPELLDRLGAKLWETNAEGLWWFGKGMAVGSVDLLSMFARIVNSFQTYGGNRTNLFLLSGYIMGVYESNPQLAREIVGDALEIPNLQHDAINIILSVPIVSWNLIELIKLAQGGKVEACCFEKIDFGRARETIPDSDLVKLLTGVNALDRGYISTLRILSKRFSERVQGEYVPTYELCGVGRLAIRKLVSAHREELNQLRLHRMDRVVKHVLSTSAPQNEVKEIIDLLCEGIAARRLYAFELAEIIGLLIKTYPEFLLAAVFDRSEKDDLLGVAVFKERVHMEGASLNDAPLNRILMWCGTNQERIFKVAKWLHAYSVIDVSDAMDEKVARVILSEQIKSVLDVAEDKLAIVEVIFQNTSPNTWSGSRADIFEARSKAFAELLDHSDPEVLTLVRNKLTLLEYRIRIEREQETAEHNEREKRFE